MLPASITATDGGCTSEFTPAPSGTAPLLRYTLLTSETRATKQFDIAPDGSLTKTSSTTPYAGRLDLQEIPADLHVFADRLDDLNERQCIVLGVLKDGRPSAPLTTKSRWSPDDPSGAVARSTASFGFPRDGLAPLLLDHDPSERCALSEDEYEGLIRSLDPALADVGILIRPSSSSFVRSIDGAIDTGRCGLHAWAMIAGGDAGVASFREWLQEKLSAAGHVWCVVSAAASVLVRFPIDLSPIGEATRIIYAAPPVLGPRLELYGRETRRVTGNAALAIDFSKLAPLTADDRAAAEKNIGAARAAVADEAARVRAERLGEEARRIRAVKPTVSEHEAERRARRMFEARELHPDAEVVVVENGLEVTVTAAMILKDPKRFHRALCLDPVEPEYQGRKVVGILYVDGAPCVWSQAHGGVLYSLCADRRTVILRAGDLGAFCEDVMDGAAESGGFFQRAGAVVVPHDGGLLTLSKHGLAHELGLRLTVKTWKAKNGRPVAGAEPKYDEVPADFPPAAADRIFNNPRLTSRLPLVEGYRRDPLLLPDGRLLTGFGHDSATRLLLEIADPCDDIPVRPTVDDIRAAAKVLLAPSSAYRFTSDRDRSVLMLALLTAASRPGYEGAPGFVFEASTRGSGKTRLASVVGIQAGGFDLIDASSRGEELGKRIDAFLVNPRRCGALLLDNLATGDELNLPEIATALTSPRKSIRIYGRNDSVSEVSTRYTFTATANNPRMLGDAARRWLSCRIEPAGVSPHLERFAFSPEAVATATRPAMIRAAVVLLRAGLGRSVPVELGSFEVWSRFVGAALDATVDAGVSGLLPVAAVVAGDGAAVDPQHEALQAFADALEACALSRDRGLIDGDGDGDSFIRVPVASLRERIVDGFGRRSTSLTPGNEAVAVTLDGLCDATGRRLWNQSGVLHPPLLGQLFASLRGALFPRRKGGATWTVDLEGSARTRRVVLRASV